MLFEILGYSLDQGSGYGLIERIIYVCNFYFPVNTYVHVHGVSIMFRSISVHT